MAEQIYTLGSVVREALVDAGETTMIKYAKWYMWAERIYRQFNLTTSPKIDIVTLKMTPYNAILLPNKCVSLLKVGIQRGDKVFQFSKSPDIALKQKVADDGHKIKNKFVSLQKPNGTNPSLYSPMIGSYGYGRGYGFGVAWNLMQSRPTYRFDEASNTIQFDSSVSIDQEIYIEYMTDGLDVCDETLISPKATETIRTYIHYQVALFDKQASLGQRDYLRRQHMAAYNLFRALTFSSNNVTIENILRQNYKLSNQI
jgi:hypothetical protein